MNAAMSDTPAPLLPPELVTMMGKGVSVIVSACSLEMRPSIMRAVGCTIAPGGQSITVYLLTPEAKAAYDQAVEELANFKLVHAENRATLSAAQTLASSDLTELYGDDMDRLCPHISQRASSAASIGLTR